MKSEIIATSPRSAAKKLARRLRQEAKAIGASPTNIFVWSPKETKSRGWGSGWAVCWEEGPFEWALNLAGGGSIYNLHTGTTAVKVIDQANYYCEPYNGFILNFYPN